MRKFMALLASIVAVGFATGCAPVVERPATSTHDALLGGGVSVLLAVGVAIFLMYMIVVVDRSRNSYKRRADIAEAQVADWSKQYATVREAYVKCEQDCRRLEKEVDGLRTEALAFTHFRKYMRELAWLRIRIRSLIDPSTITPPPESLTDVVVKHELDSLTYAPPRVSGPAVIADIVHPQTQGAGGACSAGSAGSTTRRTESTGVR